MHVIMVFSVIWTLDDLQTTGQVVILIELNELLADAWMHHPQGLIKVPLFHGLTANVLLQCKHGSLMANGRHLQTNTQTCRYTYFNFIYICICCKVGIAKSTYKTCIILEKLTGNWESWCSWKYYMYSICPSDWSVLIPPPPSLLHIHYNRTLILAWRRKKILVLEVW